MDEIEVFETFEGIRKVWETDEWWYAVVDVIELLTDSSSPSEYWRDMKRRDESGELRAICPKFPMKNKSNGRTYQTECANEERMLRIIQSISSPKAEPFKIWLAKTGARRLDEIRNDPIELEREKYRLKGYDEEWINARLNSKSVRNELTDEWERREVEGRQYGILTNEIHEGTFEGMSVQKHKDLKGVKKGSLRDHMTPIELAFTILGETTAIDEIRDRDARGFKENRQAAKRAGEIGGNLRRSYEEQTGRKVISDKSYIEERKRLLAHGSVGKCDSCQNPVRESQTYGTEAGNLCEECFAAAVERREINEDGEIL